jgi:hypothetical protein
MKNFSVAVIIGVSLLFPAALFAQSDGGAISDPTPAVLPIAAPVVAAPTKATAEAQPAPASPRPTTPQPVAAPIPSPAPSQPVVSLDDVKDIVDTAAEHAPSSLSPIFAAISGVLAGIIALLGIQSLLKSRKKKGSKPCPQCKGNGHVDEADICTTCNGTRLAEEEQDVSAECLRCKGEGVEPCPACRGEGKKGGVDCAACTGSGTKKDEDDADIDCSLCGGEGELSTTVKRPVPCPDCQN